LTPLGLRSAWVTQDAEGIAGHVVLRDDRHGDPEAIEVSRLFVRPSARRQKHAVRLLDTCREQAAALGLELVLETIDGSAAMVLYEATGWQRTDSRTADWVDRAGAPVILHRYRLSPRSMAV
jgi:GNAT superfamily N-acetyltransferase